tara:strand:+ start:699 stop:824 length:126 start_codon:yes stop_codon:yes gene_type:complete
MLTSLGTVYALQAAIAMLRALERYNEGRSKATYDPIRIGIG